MERLIRAATVRERTPFVRTPSASAGSIRAATGSERMGRVVRLRRTPRSDSPLHNCRVGWPRSFGPGGVDDMRLGRASRSSGGTIRPRSSPPPPPKEVGHPPGFFNWQLVIRNLSGGWANAFGGGRFHRCRRRRRPRRCWWRGRRCVRGSWPRRGRRERRRSSRAMPTLPRPGGG